MNERALDDPVGESLRGPHTGLARGVGRAVGYLPGVATFVAVPPGPAAKDWESLAALLGRGGFADLFSAEVTPPRSWEPVFSLDGVQMVAARGPRAARVVDDDFVELGVEDVPEMLALAAATSPGPMWERTIEMGTYLGVRRCGRLVAMAGERLHPPGWQEISAVCTAPDARGDGLAGALVGELVRRVVGRGEQAFLHVAAGNEGAQRLYRRLGFEVRRDVVFRGWRVP